MPRGPPTAQCVLIVACCSNIPYEHEGWSIVASISLGADFSVVARTNWKHPVSEGSSGASRPTINNLHIFSLWHIDKLGSVSEIADIGIGLNPATGLRAFRASMRSFLRPSFNRAFQFIVLVTIVTSSLVFQRGSALGQHESPQPSSRFGT